MRMARTLGLMVVCSSKLPLPVSCRRWHRLLQVRSTRRLALRTDHHASPPRAQTAAIDGNGCHHGVKFDGWNAGRERSLGTTDSERSGRGLLLLQGLQNNNRTPVTGYICSEITYHVRPTSRPVIRMVGHEPCRSPAIAAVVSRSTPDLTIM